MPDLPDPTDPVTSALEKTIEESFKAGKELLGAIGGPAAVGFGGMLGDQFRYWRWLNALRLLDKTANKLQRRGVDPRKVLPPTLVLLLEAASLEENDDLREKWASLLASAADPDAASVTPSFPDILRRLTSIEVAIFDYIAAKPKEPDPFLKGRDDASQIQTATQAEVEQRFTLEPEQFGVIASHLHGLGICEAGHAYVVTRLGGSGTSSRSYDSLTLTPFGLAFVNACQYP